MSSQHMSTDTNFFLLPWDKNKQSPFIDQSLASKLDTNIINTFKKWIKMPMININYIRSDGTPFLVFEIFVIDSLECFLP